MSVRFFAAGGSDEGGELDANVLIVGEPETESACRMVSRGVKARVLPFCAADGRDEEGGNGVEGAWDEEDEGVASD